MATPSNVRDDLANTVSEFGVFMRVLLAVFLSFIALTSFAAAQDQGPEEAAIRDMWYRFEKAFNDTDAKAAAAIYAPDGDRVNSSGVYSKGRKEIEKGYQAIFDRRKGDSSSVPFHAKIEVRFLRPDVALLDGTWTGNRGGKKVKGVFTLFVTKEDGVWLIAAGRDRGVIDEQ